VVNPAKQLPKKQEEGTKMKKMQLAVIFALLFACAGQVFAVELNVSGLFRAKGCHGCHQDRAVGIGPSYLDVSNRYRGVTNAKTRLIEVVLNGTREGDGNYRWGTIRMPGPSRRVPVNESEAEILVNYIMSLQQ
jgi:cytochrome c